MTIVYGLRLVGSEELRYVGQTDRCAKTRLAEHQKLAAETGRRLPLYHWLRKHHEVEAVVLVRDGRRNFAEQVMIRRYRQLGHRLLNCTDGGDGSAGRVVTDEYREACRQRQLGRPKSTSHRLKMRGNSGPKANRINADKVLQIREMSAAGLGNAQIGAQLGISRGTVYNVVVGRVWAYV